MPKGGRKRYKGRATATTGAMHELIVAIDLFHRGYAVFRALSPACSCDLIAMKDNKILRVEVRTGKVNPPTGRLMFIKGNPDYYDLFAVVVEKGQITYLPNAPD